MGSNQRSLNKAHGPVLNIIRQPSRLSAQTSYMQLFQPKPGLVSILTLFLISIYICLFVCLFVFFLFPTGSTVNIVVYTWLKGYDHDQLISNQLMEPFSPAQICLCLFFFFDMIQWLTKKDVLVSKLIANRTMTFL